MAEIAFFWTLATLAVLSAASVVLPAVGRNPVHGALALIGCFFCLAGIYVLLAAHLVAAVQIIVYAGAIMVLFMFVIMLLNLSDTELGNERYTTSKFIGIGALLLLFTVLVRLIGAGTPASQATLPGPELYGGVTPVGNLLLRTYMIPFELISILLLVAVVGAVVLAKKKVP